MEYADESQYDETLTRPPMPMFWVVLSGLLGVCCLGFFVVSAVETYWLLNGYTLVAQASTNASKPSLGEIKFYADQTPNNDPSGPAVTRLPTNSKALYAYFTYKNVPKTGVTWSYSWTFNGSDLPGASKTNQRWTRDGNGTYFVKLADDKGLKPGVYEILIDLADDEQSASVIVAP